MRRRLAAFGAVAVLVGLFVSFRQEFAGLIPASWVFVLLIAVAAGVQSVTTALSRRRTALREEETGDPERRYEAPTPGDDLTETLRFARRSSRRGDRPREQLRERIAEVAVAGVADAADCSEAEARERLRTGEWTDDPVAAWFLGEAVRLHPAERARLLATAPFSQYEAAFDRTVRVVDDLVAHGGER
ncbi:MULTISPECIES: DUF7269 family protein [Halolamina]|uniref:Uncharacterized protein n=1 Tax=Halolamina pelagica TaxID=699431 RepID=A0A1I5PV68_9EURY|nr:MULTISPECIES: hypothetical protein [Halolamina]NHX34966.1 hypothetical protein [Halolamina sp. R1-12]SFP37973.1 hypothetical protein SAMN05216277_103122 [Halolamina pelagica]